MPSKFLAAPAMLAAISLSAAPSEAAIMPMVSQTSVAADDGFSFSAGYGPRGGRSYRHHHRNRGTSAGDVLAGVLVIGTIAAVASAANRASERRSYPVPAPYPVRASEYRRGGPQGLDGAADMCVREIERDARVGEVTTIERDAEGWLVTGVLADGAGFTCSIGADGRIDNLDLGGGARGLAVDDRQYDAESYRLARARVDGAVPSQQQPAYPGGPLPGEEFEDDGPEL